MKKITWLTLISFIVVSAFFYTGCKKDDNESGISLPPSETMDMDFTFTQKKSMLAGDDTSNYRIARTVVSYWALKAAERTAIPIFSFKKALQNNPVYDAELDIYTWTYQFQVTAENYEANLTGEIWGDSIEWEMNITKVGGDVPFKYYEGTSAIDRSGGWWKIYSPEAGASLKINWTRESDNVGTLRYTNIISGDDNNGAYIEFAKVNSTVFDRYFKIYVVSNPDYTPMNGKTYTIEWNYTNRNGKTSDGTTSYCWDNKYVNGTCQ